MSAAAAIEIGSDEYSTFAWPLKFRRAGHQRDLRIGAESIFARSLYLEARESRNQARHPLLYLVQDASSAFL